MCGCGGGCSSASSSSSSSGGCGGGCGAPAPAPACGGGCAAPKPKCSACPPTPPPGPCCAPIPEAAPQEPGAPSQPFKSKFEKKILCGKCPVDVSETATTCANGVKGIFVNKEECDSFSGPIPLSEYEIFNDPKPKVINKVMSSGGAAQEITVKFLQPPAGGPAGEIVIRERAGPAAPGAPPVIIRQEGKTGCAGKPQCFRECPPPPPPKICPKLIEICQSAPPPPRRVIIEKLPDMPGAPGPVYAERWLPAQPGCRNVVYEPAPKCGCEKKVRNVIICWSAPSGPAKTSANAQGPEPANPCEYKKKYGSQLVTSDKLPACVKSVKPPKGAGNGVPKLTGCVAALKLVDLAEHGLSEYAAQVNKAK